jgi:hypothetical protein
MARQSTVGVDGGEANADSLLSSLVRLIQAPRDDSLRKPDDASRGGGSELRPTTR